jgi:heptosyltransferase I
MADVTSSLFHRPARVLIVKTSSLGDVVHALPALTDLRRALPDTQVDWLVEESFAEIPRLHAGVGKVLTVALRRWRKSWWKAETRKQWREAKAALRAQPYDAVIDLQGLLKSAWLTRAASLTPTGKVHGYDRHSAREPWSARFYGQCHRVALAQHAIARNRALTAAALSYAVDVSPPPDYGLTALPATRSGVLLLPATSRADKAWPPTHWVALAQQLQASGHTCTLVAGTPTERSQALAIAQAAPGATLAPPGTIADLASRMRESQAVVGVDTGLTHLAAAHGLPCIGLFTATDPARTGVWGARAHNVGGVGLIPSVDAVLDALQRANTP